MNEKYFPVVERWHLPESVLRDSITEMSRDGADGNEGVVLWLGRRENREARITHLVALRGPQIIKRPAQLIIHQSLFAEVTDLAIDLGISLIGQIHSHGPGYGTDLSVTDRMYGVSVPYYLSLVAPDYAMRPSISLLECGIHVLEPGRGFRRLSSTEVCSCVMLIRESCSPIMVVGEKQYA
jgi:proteasome lid subunit RPN8/RPN11